VRAEAITAVIEPAGNAAANYLRDVPAWIRADDHAVVVLLNVALVIEIVLVFAGTMVRTFFHSSALMGIDELSPLFLVTLAFMGGAVAYSRGQFIAITILVDRAPGRLRALPTPVFRIGRPSAPAHRARSTRLTRSPETRWV